MGHSHPDLCSLSSAEWQQMFADPQHVVWEVCTLGLLSLDPTVLGQSCVEKAARNPPHLHFSGALHTDCSWKD